MADEIFFFFSVPTLKKEICLLPIQENLTTEGSKITWWAGEA